MAVKAAARAELCRLRRDIARIEGRLAEADRLVLDSAGAEPSGRVTGMYASPETGRGGALPRAAPFRPRDRRGRLRLGFDALDRMLGGGLPLATLHEIRARESRDGGAAAGFALALVARLAEAGEGPKILWISEADCRRETGGLYAPGLLALGLDPGCIVQVATRSETEALWAFEAALACRGLGVAVCELRQASLDLTATRRCVLRAREAGVTGLLLRLASRTEPTAAELRFRLAPAPAGQIGDFAAGVGRMAWTLGLEKNRGGRTGVFTVEWKAHERCLAERSAKRNRWSAGQGEGWRRADPQPLPAAPPHRPHPPAEAGRAGEISSGRGKVAGNWLRAS